MCFLLEPSRKMNPLRLNQSVSEIVVVSPIKESTLSLKKLKTLLFYVLMIVMRIINTIFSGLNFVVYVKINCVEGLYGLLLASTLICNFHTLITLRYYFTKLWMIFSTLNDIYRECKYKSSF